MAHSRCLGVSAARHDAPLLPWRWIWPGDRTYDEIAGLLDGLEFIEPGLVYLHEWWPDGPQPAEQHPVMYTLLDAVGRKP